MGPVSWHVLPRPTLRTTVELWGGRVMMAGLVAFFAWPLASAAGFGDMLYLDVAVGCCAAGALALLAAPGLRDD